MPPLGPIKRERLIRHMRQLNFTGPYSGGKHQFMVKGKRTVRLPNPHQHDIGAQLLLRILRQAGIARNKWEKL